MYVHVYLGVEDREHMREKTFSGSQRSHKNGFMNNGRTTKMPSTAILIQPPGKQRHKNVHMKVLVAIGMIVSWRNKVNFCIEKMFWIYISCKGLNAQSPAKSCRLKQRLWLPVCYFAGDCASLPGLTQRMATRALDQIIGVYLSCSRMPCYCQLGEDANAQISSRHTRTQKDICAQITLLTDKTRHIVTSLNMNTPRQLLKCPRKIYQNNCISRVSWNLTSVSILFSTTTFIPIVCHFFGTRVISPSFGCTTTWGETNDIGGKQTVSNLRKTCWRYQTGATTVEWQVIHTLNHKTIAYLSHVLPFLIVQEIAPSRNEILVILYTWNRRMLWWSVWKIILCCTTRMHGYERSQSESNIVRNCSAGWDWSSLMVVLFLNDIKS